MKLFFRWKVYGLENIPSQGGFLLAVNHASYFDPVIVGSASSRLIYYLARRSLMKNKFIESILKSVNTIPVARGEYDSQALKEVVDLVKKGSGVLVFPEGTRSKTGNLQKIKNGLGFLAMQSQADILPCYLDGTWHILPKGKKMISLHKVTVSFGKVIPYTEFSHLKAGKEAYQSIAARTESSLLSMREGLTDD